MSSLPPPEHPGIPDRIRAGDERAFEELFHSYYAPLCAFAHRLVGSPEAAEEVVQAVFLRLWAGRTRLGPQTNVRAYLYAATRNRSLDHLKRAGVERRWLTEGGWEDDLPPEGDDAQRRLEADEATNALRAAVERLPERARLVVTLRWVHGLRPPEIAEALGISVKGVEIQITRALRALRGYLKEGFRTD